MKLKRKSGIYVILSVLTGIGCAILIFFILFGSFFSLGLIGWSDGGDPAYLHRLEITTNISVAISIIVPLAGAIFIVYKMNKPNDNIDN